ncbi:GntR family transcriptional regulator, partial [Novosphingobium sp. FGD1]|nr:GntR family transcriptional regulator [Novosphingobium silvae]
MRRTRRNTFDGSMVRYFAQRAAAKRQRQVKVDTLASLSNGAATLAGERLEQGPVPLYYQLEQRLRARITSNEFLPGTALPTEDQICAEYSVSRITVRRALAALAQQGLIDRRRGVGSFVAEKLKGINSHLTGSLNEFLAMAGSLNTRCLSLGRADPPIQVRNRLGLEHGEHAVLLRTVGSLEEGPVAYLEIWFPPSIGDNSPLPKSIFRDGAQPGPADMMISSTPASAATWPTRAKISAF